MARERLDIRLVGVLPETRRGQVFSAGGVFVDMVLWLFDRHGGQDVDDAFLGALETGQEGKLSSRECVAVSRRISDWLDYGKANYLAMLLGLELNEIAGDGLEWVWVSEETTRLAAFLNACGGCRVLGNEP